LDTHRITQNLEPKSNRTTGQLLRPGVTLVNRYLIQEQIGLGGMSAVYKARDLHFPNVVKWVAVKEMFIQARDPLVRKTIVRNFEREANILATLHHPSIPRIFDYFTQEARSYLVLEFIEGKDLEALLTDSEEFFHEQQVVSWAIELCDVLSYLHHHEPEMIVFRDMKPSNVMINQHNHVMLVDFGIAKHFQSGQKGTMIGTEGYAPPEQYRGEASHLADIYALGATLHHLLTRKDPRLEAPFYFQDCPVRKVNPTISPELEAVVNRALQYNPEDRYQSAEEMKEALIGAAHKTGILSKISLPAPSVSTFEQVSIAPAWTFECEDEIRGSASLYNGILYIGSYDHNVYALQAKSGTFEWKYASDGGIVSRPAYFDANVIFGSEDHRVHVITARNGRLLWTHYTSGPVRSSPCVGEGHIFIGSDDGNLYAINLTSGRQSWSFESGGPVRSTPSLSPGDETIYFGNEVGDFFCLNFRGQVRWRFKAKRAITSSPLVADGVVYFGSVDSMLYALDAQTGWVIWRFRLDKPSISSPCIAENLVFTGAADGNIYCVDARTSKEIWRFQCEKQVTGSPVIYKDSLYCGSVDQHVYCLEYRTGRLRWKYQTGGPITGTPTAGDDFIYIGSLDHKVYALPAG
jgi:outer membrane protein assembly factor BamB/tRNA A-37 threonylcarbamoyl transferase component Bud32